MGAGLGSTTGDPGRARSTTPPGAAVCTAAVPAFLAGDSAGVEHSAGARRGGEPLGSPGRPAASPSPGCELCQDLDMARFERGRLAPESVHCSACGRTIVMVFVEAEPRRARNTGVLPVLPERT